MNRALHISDLGPQLLLDTVQAHRRFVRQEEESAFLFDARLHQSFDRYSERELHFDTVYLDAHAGTETRRWIRLWSFIAGRVGTRAGGSIHLRLAGPTSPDFSPILKTMKEAMARRNVDANRYSFHIDWAETPRSDAPLTATWERIQQQRTKEWQRRLENAQHPSFNELTTPIGTTQFALSAYFPLGSMNDNRVSYKGPLITYINNAPR